MPTISLHGIKITAPHGLYPQEQVLNNDFEIDADITVPDQQPWPFVDYTLVREIVATVFRQPDLLLETFVLHIHEALRLQFQEAIRVKVAVRKLHPPMPGEVAYAQVCYEA